jgi:hypothetical protein
MQFLVDDSHVAENRLMTSVAPVSHAAEIPPGNLSTFQHRTTGTSLGQRNIDEYFRLFNGANARDFDATSSLLSATGHGAGHQLPQNVDTTQRFHQFNMATSSSVPLPHIRIDEDLPALQNVLLRGFALLPPVSRDSFLVDPRSPLLPLTRLPSVLGAHGSSSTSIASAVQQQALIEETNRQMLTNTLNAIPTVFGSENVYCDMLDAGGPTTAQLAALIQYHNQNGTRL